MRCCVRKIELRVAKRTGSERTRRGLTLVELLVVIGVMVILLSLSLPLLRGGLEGRQTREASRQLSTYVELAKALAAETGKPAGLVIEAETMAEAPAARFASRLYLAETPLPFTGNIVHATITVAGSAATFSDPPDTITAAAIGIGPGDLIRLDYRGPLYRIDAFDASTNQLTISGTPLPPDGSYAYQIYRQPKVAGSPPLDLPTDTVIDLTWSGFGLNDDTSFDNPQKQVTVVFEPNGSIGAVLGIGLGTTPPNDTLHLLVGKFENVFPDPNSNVSNANRRIDNNLEDPECRWVSISHLSGKVTVAENGGTPQDPTPSVAVAREFAQSAQSMGGR